jgi:hypothetical protein
MAVKRLDYKRPANANRVFHTAKKVAFTASTTLAVLVSTLPVLNGCAVKGKGVQMMASNATIAYELTKPTIVQRYDFVAKTKQDDTSGYDGWKVTDMDDNGITVSYVPGNETTGTTPVQIKYGEKKRLTSGITGTGSYGPKADKVAACYNRKNEVVSPPIEIMVVKCTIPGTAIVTAVYVRDTTKNDLK